MESTSSISANLRHALTYVLEKTIMARTVGSDGAATYYPMMARTVDMASFFLESLGSLLTP